MTNASPGKTHAFIVGINTYDKRYFCNLNGPVADALSFAKWLRRRGVPPGNIQLFLSPCPGDDELASDGLPPAREATEYDIHNLGIKKILCEKSGDLFWFFGAGHGYGTVKGGLEHRILYRDADRKFFQSLPLKDLMVAMRTGTFEPFAKQVFIADTCVNMFADPAYAEEPGGGELSKKRFKKGRRQFFLSSASEGEYAADRSIFFDLLLERLESSEKTAPGQWPPNMTAIGNHICGEFKRLGDEGKTFQEPQCLAFGWQDREMTSAVISPIPPGQPISAEILIREADDWAGGLEQALGRVDISKIYMQTAPRVCKSPPPECEPLRLFSKCFRKLAERSIPTVEGMHPALDFINGLSLHFDGAARKATLDWLEKALERLYEKNNAEALKTSLDSPATRKRLLHSPAETPRTLMVRLTPENIRQTRFGVDAWLLGGLSSRRLWAGKEAVSLETLKELLPGFLRQATRDRCRKSELCIEFMLPGDQLTACVEHWKIGAGTYGPLPIGVKYQVMLRSPTPARLEGLKQRWTAPEAPRELPGVDEYTAGADAGITACWIPALHPVNLSHFKEWLNRARQLMCVILGENPGTRAGGKDLLETLLGAGVPILLWPREACQGDARALKEELSRLVREDNLEGLPARVWRWRRDFDSEVCRNLTPDLTLLYDDPGRLPPDHGHARGTGPRASSLGQEGGQADIQGGMVETAHVPFGHDADHGDGGTDHIHGQTDGGILEIST